MNACVNECGESATTFLKQMIFFYKLCEGLQIPHTACGNITQYSSDPKWLTVGKFNPLYDEVIEGNYSTKYFILVFVGLLRIP